MFSASGWLLTYTVGVRRSASLSIGGLVMRWFKKPPPANHQFEEDPVIYGPIFKEFRQTMRKFNGVVPCRMCGSMSTLRLENIEKDIRKNIARQKMLSSQRTAFVILPDWTQGAVCLKCVSYFCGRCVQQAFQHKSESREQLLRVLLRNLPGNTPPELLESELSSIQHTVLCPQCHDDLLLGIDHITD